MHKQEGLFESLKDKNYEQGKRMAPVYGIQLSPSACMHAWRQQKRIVRSELPDSSIQNK